MGFQIVFFSSPGPPARVYGGLAITRWHLDGMPTRHELSDFHVVVIVQLTGFVGRTPAD